jgi:hypothetical protein
LFWQSHHTSWRTCARQKLQFPSKSTTSAFGRSFGVGNGNSGFTCVLIDFPETQTAENANG